MRGRDEDTGEFFSPSRSAQRRAALDVLELCEQLVGMSAAQLGRLRIPEQVLPHLRDAQRITSHIARKRQIAFLAKQVRKLDEEAIDAIRDALSKDGEAARRETAAMHRLEALRDALLGEDGDAAMTDLLAAHPGAVQQLGGDGRQAFEPFAAVVGGGRGGERSVQWIILFRCEDATKTPANSSAPVAARNGARPWTCWNCASSWWA